MSFKDFVNNSLLGGTDITISRIFTVLALSCLLAAWVFATYRLHNRTSFYSREINITVALMPIVTAGIVLAMQSNLVISLGMVGALSIVRFRTAIKEPLDLFFLFWSVGIGIMCGAGLYLLAFIICLAVTHILVLLNLLPEITPPPLILSASLENEDSLKNLESDLSEKCKSINLCSCTVSRGRLELVAELRSKEPKAILTICNSCEGVISASLLSRDGSVVRG